MDSIKQYLRMIVMFFACLLLLLIWQGYSDYQKFKQFHQELSKRSVTTTSREITSLIKSTKKTVLLFTEQEHEALLKLLTHSFFDDQQFANEKNRIAKKIHRYFPHHLTFLLADKHGVIQYNHTEQLVGKTCRRELISYSKRNFKDNPVFVHHGPILSSDHFDVLTPITNDQGEKVGVFFISFKLETLRRVLTHGEVVDHHLLLLRKNNPSSIELRGNIDYLAENEILPNKLKKRVFYSIPIENTLWDLVDIPDSSLFNSEYRRLFVQSSIVLLVFLLISGLMLWLLKKEEMKSGKTRGLLSALENERRRIAMDMHDQVLSELSHITRDTNQLATSPNCIKSTEKITQLQNNLGEVTNSIRAIINDLHPHILDNLGLESALRDCLQKHMNHDDSPEWTLSIDDKIEPLLNNEQRFNLYRIILEIVNNIQKHANCTHFSISIRLQNKHIKMLIADNGIGFDVSKNHKGLGLSNIETRSRLLNAEISWSKPKNNNGSHFKLTKKIAL